jgi:hypothetical protein
MWVQRYPDRFNQTDEHGNKFTTLGAGPQSTGCGGTLLSGYNRDRDVEELADDWERLAYDPTREDEIIQTLITLDENYDDNLTYECYPDTGTDEYNSNS